MEHIAAMRLLRDFTGRTERACVQSGAQGPFLWRRACTREMGWGGERTAVIASTGDSRRILVPGQEPCPLREQGPSVTPPTATPVGSSANVRSHTHGARTRVATGARTVCPPAGARERVRLRRLPALTCWAPVRVAIRGAFITLGVRVCRCACVSVCACVCPAESAAASALPKKP